MHHSRSTARILVLAALAPALAWAQGLVRPPWIEVLPQQQGRIYAVGVAPLGASQAQALKQAGQNARIELASRLRATVKGETTIHSQSTQQRELGGLASASSQQKVTQDSKIATQIAELNGLSISETWTDSEGATVYALACLDVAAAMGNLQGRADAVRKGQLSLDAGADPRLAARAALQIRKGREEVARLDELATPVIDAGGDPAFRTQLQSLRSDLDRRSDQVRGLLTVSVDPGLPPDLLAALRNAAEQQGFGWTEGRGLLHVRILASGKTAARTWWTEEASSDFITLKASLKLEAADRAGAPRGTASLDITGVGTSQANAVQGLLKDARRRLESTLDRWLADLAL